MIQRDLVPQAKLAQILASVEASQLLEFAVVLPLLAVLVIGIFDFGSALNLKQELSTAAREGAAFGANLPTNDVGPAGQPQSVVGVRNLVDANLLQSRINDCGLGPAAQGSSSWIWVATGTCSGGTFTLTINRGYVFKGGANGLVDVVATQVSISYPYQWTFNSIIQLLVPGATYSATIQLAASSTVPNLL
jgi:Flp pilus assembly protein TadG